MLKRERGRRGKQDAESAKRGVFSASSFLRLPRSLFINIFLVFGIAALSYVGYTMLDARLHQAEQSRRFELELKGARTVPATSTESVEKPERIVREGDSLGRIEIHRIGLKAMIEEGVSAETLRRAVGHIPGTPLPGERGNIVKSSIQPMTRFSLW
jgi:sortase (surface protein transpeptidase)